MLSNIEILDNIKSGNIIIEPFESKLLNTNSYDVRLGEWYCLQQNNHPDKAIRYNTEDGQKFMWNQPIKAKSGIIAVDSGETILAHTEEIIGGRNIITTEMRAKSTTGRYGLSVCKCAGLGDVGFISRWTMEITNHSNFCIWIPVGEPIAQIIFHKVEPPASEYKGRYGQGSWTPNDMLPKVKK